MNRDAYDAIVIGAGHNGLVTAAYLAQAGLNVLVLERRHLVGGAATTEEIFPGYRVSTCAGIVHVLQTKIVHDLDLVRHGYRTRPVDPLHLWPLPDGRRAIFWRAPNRTRKELERFSIRDASAYVERWLPFWQRAGGIMRPFFLTVPPTISDLRATLQGADADLFARLLEGSLLELLEETFETDEVRAATMHSYDVLDLEEPGVLLSYASIWAAQPVDPLYQGFPVGGVGSLAEAIARSALHHGAKIRLGAEVDRIIFEAKHAAGVVLTDGQELRSRLVVSDADPKRTYLDLVGTDVLGWDISARVRALVTECGTMKFHVALNELPDLGRYQLGGAGAQSVAVLRIGPSVDYYRQCCADARAGRLARSPLITAFIPSAVDSTIAPTGKHVLSMWIRYVPVHPADGTWDELRRAQAEILIDLMNEYAPNFRRSIIEWRLDTPSDIERRTYMTDGNYHHTNHILGQLLGDRLLTGGGYRSPLSGLYLCGAGTHPGGEISGAPGHNAAAVILNDLGRFASAA